MSYSSLRVRKTRSLLTEISYFLYLTKVSVCFPAAIDFSISISRPGYTPNHKKGKDHPKKNQQKRQKKTQHPTTQRKPTKNANTRTTAPDEKTRESAKRKTGKEKPRRRVLNPKNERQHSPRRQHGKQPTMERHVSQKKHPKNNIPQTPHPSKNTDVNAATSTAHTAITETDKLAKPTHGYPGPRHGTPFQLNQHETPI
jgi:hypothetical protein